MRINKIINWFSNSLESVLWTEGDEVLWTEGDEVLWGDASNWILASNAWNDSGIWIDYENWND